MTKTCLVVDDSRVVRKVSRGMLEALGFTVEEAENGQEAYERCRTRPLPEFILLDWNMPVMNGIEFLHKFRTLPENEFTVVIFCTTENDAGAIERAINAGANEYIMKPFDKDILHDKLLQLGLVEE